jgi:hypothetical protein
MLKTELVSYTVHKFSTQGNITLSDIKLWLDTTGLGYSPVAGIMVNLRFPEKHEMF